MKININILPSIVDKSADESEDGFILFAELILSLDCVARGIVPNCLLFDINPSVVIDEDDDDV